MITASASLKISKPGKLTYHVENPHKKDGTTFRALRGLRGVEFGIKEGHFSLGFQTGRTSGLAENSNLRQARQTSISRKTFSRKLKSAWLA